MPEGDIYLLNRAAWDSLIYAPHMAEISQLAATDGKKGLFRDDAPNLEPGLLMDSCDRSRPIAKIVSSFSVELT